MLPKYLATITFALSTLPTCISHKGDEGTLIRKIATNKAGNAELKSIHLYASLPKYCIKNPTQYAREYPATQPTIIAESNLPLNFLGVISLTSEIPTA